MGQGAPKRELGAPAQRRMSALQPEMHYSGSADVNKMTVTCEQTRSNINIRN